MELANLQYLGLTEGEIRVYRVLLENGPLSASQIVKITGLKKGDGYNKLYDLVQKGLIEEFDQKKKKHFRLKDPRRLDEITSGQYQTALQAKREIEAILPGVLSAYTLTHHQPGIVMFEGEEAQRRILEDSLTAEGDILQYVDLESVLNLYPDVNREFARKRAKLGKRKRILLPDNQLSQDYAKKVDPAITEIRLIKYQLPRFSTVMQIYNNKISYFTLKPDSMIGVIIEDPLISLMHRAFFEFMWQQASPTYSHID